MAVPMTEDQIKPFDLALRKARLPWFPASPTHEWFVAQDVANGLPSPQEAPQLAGYWFNVDPALAPGVIELRPR